MLSALNTAAVGQLFKSILHPALGKLPSASTGNGAVLPPPAFILALKRVVTEIAIPSESAPPEAISLP